VSNRIANHLRSNVIGYVAVFIALSGTAYAVDRVGPNEIAKNAVMAKHVKKNAIRTADVKDGGLRPKDVRGLVKALATLKELQAALGGAGGYLGKLQSDLDALTARVNALEAQNGNVLNNLGDLEGTLNGLTGQLNGLLGDLDALGGLDALDLRLDNLCSQLDLLNQETIDLESALNIPALIGGLIGLDLSGVDIANLNQAVCSG
jgi:ABC-type transporter Mla subunit MlaD